MKNILILSAQHTGTWFIINIVETITNKKVVLLKDCYNNYDPNDIVHTHVINFHPWNLNESLRIPCYYKLIDSDETKLIIPLRDPLLSIFTRQNRHPDMDHKYLVDSFVFLSSFLNDKRAFFFPIDLYDKEKNEKMAMELCDFVGGVYNNEVKKIIYNWKAINETKDHFGLKSLYKDNKYDEIRNIIGEEFSYLLNHSSSILPFFKKFGYKFSWEHLVKL